MIKHEQHVMQRVTAHDTGAEEWLCSSCGRRLLIDSQPVFNRAVVDAGDEYATHSGGSGGGSAELDNEVTLELLSPWLKAFKAIKAEGYEGV